MTETHVTRRKRLMEWASRRRLAAGAWLTRNRGVLEDSVKLITIGSALTASILYFTESPDRRLDRLYKAWDVVGRAANDKVNGARDAALEDLADHGFPLRGIKLADFVLERVDLRTALMTESNLARASMREARLDNANLQKSNLYGVQLQSGSLFGADLRHALVEAGDLRQANLTRALLHHALMRGTILVEADLSSAVAFQADLREADLLGANLTGLDLERADLRGATLRDVRNWRGIRSLHRANIAGVVEAPDGFLRWAIDSMGAVAEPDDAKWEDVKYGVDAVPAPAVAARRLGLLPLR